MTESVYKQKYALVGVIVHGIGNWIHTVSDKWQKDPNLTIEILQQTLVEIEENHRSLPETLYLQLDNCGRENKNSSVFAYLNWLVQRKIFKRVEVSFLPVGHTHEDIDQLFGVFSRYLHKHDVPCREKLYSELKKARDGLHCRNVDKIANLKAWLGKHQNQMIGISTPLHFLISLHQETDGALQVEYPVMRTKQEATQSWEEYATASKGFELLKRDIPLTPQDVPSLIPIGIPDNYLIRIQRGLQKLKADSRLDDSDHVSLAADFAILNDTAAVPFSWPHDGKFRRERDELERDRRNLNECVLRDYRRDLARQVEEEEANAHYEDELLQAEESGKQYGALRTPKEVRAQKKQ